MTHNLLTRKVQEQKVRGGAGAIGRCSKCKGWVDSVLASRSWSTTLRYVVNPVSLEWVKHRNTGIRRLIFNNHSSIVSES